LRILENPQALAETDTDGHTPLHLACLIWNQSPDILQLLLDRSPTEVLGMCSRFGRTPLYNACSRRVSTDITRKMIRLYPKALRMLATGGNTPLHFFWYPSLCVTREA
jgi:ankyrin repeat protein